MGGQVSSGTTERWGPGRSPGVCSLRGMQSPFFTNAVLVLELGAFPSPQSLGQSRAPRPDPAQSNSHTPSQLPTHSSPAPLCSPFSLPPLLPLPRTCPGVLGSALKGTGQTLPILLLLPSTHCLAASLPKPLVPTIVPSLGDSPPPAQQPQGWAGAIFSLGTELILTHRQGTWGRAVGLGGGREGPVQESWTWGKGGGS